MTLVSSSIDLLQEVSSVMTVPSFGTFLTLAAGWVFARRRTVTGMLLAADAVGTKHHSAFHRFFVSAQWSLDELGLAVFGLIPRKRGTRLPATTYTGRSGRWYGYATASTTRDRSRRP